MRFLRQSTSVDLPIGPFLDQTDGFTAETSLTLTQPDIRLKKNAAAWAQKAAAQTLSHEEAGWYEVTLDATDTDTCGQLMLSVQETGALPVWSEFHVLEEAVYDALFAASAPGYVANAPVNVAQFGGTNLTASAGRPEVNASHAAGTAWNSGAIGAATLASDTISAAKIAADAITAAKIADGAIDAATFAAGAINAAAIAADAITDAKVASDVTIASVTGAVGSVTGAVGSVTGAVGSVASGGITTASFAANAINAAKLDPDVTTELQAGLATAAALATVDGIVDDILLDTAEIGTAGAGLTNINLPNQTMDIIGNITGNLSGSVGSVTGAVGSVTGAVGSVGTGGIAAASFAAGAIDAAAIAADAIGSSELAASAVTEIQSGLATAAALAVVDGIVDDILVDTAEIGAAGAGLTAIDLPNQTMNITGNITGNLSGSVGSVTGAVGSVTGAVGSVTGNVGGNVVGSVASVTAGVTLAASAVQAIWDALTSALTTVGSIGKLLVDNVNATISSRSSHAAADVWAVGTRLLTAGTNIVLAKGTGVTGFNDLSAAQVNTEADTALSDYDPPTRAELTTDTNSILSKLLKYVQLTLRKDAAIATDNATEVTAINADGGSGAGAFANTTDAQEAIRDNMGTAQTGDSFARLGAPAGASVSADIAAIEAQTDDIGVAGAGLTALGDTRLANLDATISSRATQASVDDLPTNAELATSQAAADDATLAAIAALNNLSAAQVNTEVDTALADIHLDHLLAVTYDPASKPGAADALLNELVESDAGVARYTANALEQAPTGGAAPTAADIADAVWDETLADHLGAGSTGAGLNAAGSAGDPWATALPGAYSSGQAGKIIGDNINATVGSRATQISVDDVPTNAELATALGTADDATLAAIAALNNLSAAGVRTAIGLASANLDTQLGDLPTNAELATALGTADDAVLAAVAALNNLSAAGVRTAIGLASANLDTQLDALPTAAEVWAAGTRTLTAGTNIVLAKGTGVTGFNDLSAAQVNAEADTALADVGVTGTVTGRIDAAVSTRATPAQVQAELGTYDVPTKAELDAAVAPLATAANLAAAKTVVDAIKLKTDNLPVDPADQSAIEAAVDAAEAAILAAIPTANVNADALLDRSNGIETSLTLRGALRLIVAASAGKLAGAATSTITIRNVGDTKDRITATVDVDGNRSAVITDAA